MSDPKHKLRDQDQSKEDREEDVARETGDVGGVSVAERAGRERADVLRGEDLPAFLVGEGV